MHLKNEPKITLSYTLYLAAFTILKTRHIL
jgi:hypothetical protein